MYVDMDDIRRANRRAGLYWFEPDTMRFFASRVGSFAYGTADGSRAYFVSSERFECGGGYGHGAHSEQRRYSVRVVDLATGDIDTVGAFQQYASRSGADRAAERFARGGAA